MSKPIDEKFPLVFGIPQPRFYDELTAPKAFIAELRPGLEGIKVVAKEFLKRGVQPVIICDNMIAFCMKKGLIREAHIFYRGRSDAGFLCRTGSFIVAFCAKIHGVPLHLHAAKSDTKAQPPLVEIGGVKVTSEKIKTYVPPVEEVPAEFVKET